MQNQQSEQFESYSDKQSQESHQTIYMQTVDQRPSYYNEKKLYEIYQKNAERKKILIAKIKELEDCKNQKQLLKQKQNNESEMYIMEVSDDEQQLPASLALIKKDYEKNKLVLDNLQEQYQRYKKQAGQMISEMDLNSNDKFRKKVQGIYHIHQYLFMKNEKKIILLYSKFDLDSYYISFRSIKFRNKLIKSIVIPQMISSINLSQSEQLLLVCSNDHFSVYNIELQKFILKSPKHDSEIVYSTFYKEQFIISITKKGIVRIFSLQNKILISIMICQGAQKYYLKDQKILYSVGPKLYSINIKNKEIKQLKDLQSKILNLSQYSIRTQMFCFNNYYQTDKIENKVEESSYEILGKIEKGGEKIEIRCEYPQKEINIGGRYYQNLKGKKLHLICSYSNENKVIVMFGEENGELHELWI